LLPGDQLVFEMTLLPGDQLVFEMTLLPGDQLVFQMTLLPGDQLVFEMTLLHKQSMLHADSSLQYKHQYWTSVLVSRRSWVHIPVSTPDILNSALLGFPQFPRVIHRDITCT
jgi:hypothetical protein